MSKSKSKLRINLNLLRPQSNPEKIFSKLFHWLLSSGRYIFVFVEALVLIAFLARFKLDADLAAKKEAIEEQIPYIESLKPYEILIRNTQLKLTTIANTRKDALDWAEVLKKLSAQTPISTKVTNINIEKEVGIANIRIIAETQINGDLTSFVKGLKEDNTFNDINISHIGLEGGLIKFTIEVKTKVMQPGKSL